MELTTELNFESADDFYQAMIDAHRGLSTEQSHAMNARLVLLLSNQIGSSAVLQTALDSARVAGMSNG
jgi:hypothetical protein